MTKRILAISGKKGSGKSTLAKFLLSNGCEIFDGNGDRPEVEGFSLADPLKQICMEILGLSFEQCYGTEEQKNTPTQIAWRDFPFKRDVSRSTHLMTAREVLQYTGTEIFRRMIPDCWARACVNAMLSSSCYLAVNDDCRFPNEADAFRGVGGKVIRLTRSPGSGDMHKSEMALDDYTFDAVIDNRDLTVTETRAELCALLRQWGWMK